MYNYHIRKANWNFVLKVVQHSTYSMSLHFSIMVTKVRSRIIVIMLIYHHLGPVNNPSIPWECLMSLHPILINPMNLHCFLIIRVMNLLLIINAVNFLLIINPLNLLPITNPLNLNLVISSVNLLPIINLLNLLPVISAANLHSVLMTTLMNPVYIHL